MRGYDKGKNVKGRNRHSLVDTLGLLLIVVVTSAAHSDAADARLLARVGDDAFLVRPPAGAAFGRHEGL